MKIYLNDKKFYIQNEDKFIYEVNAFNVYDGYDSMRFETKLLAGWDYINPDENDLQGYVPADRFREEIQEEEHIVYIMQESVNEYFKSDGWKILSEDLVKVLLVDILKG